MKISAFGCFSLNKKLANEKKCVTLQPEMCTSERVTINLKELNIGAQSFSYSLGKAYFSLLDETEISSGKINVGIEITTTDGTHFSLSIAISGSVEVLCDLCLGPMEQPIESSSHLVAVISDEESEDDDIINVSPADGTLDLSWYVYEQIALAVPIKHVHEEGQCSPEMLKKLEEFQPRPADDADSTSIDPRWEALMKLKN